MAGVVVRLAGLTFNDGPDVDGDEFVISDVVGWDSTGVEQTVVERPIATGAVYAHGRRASRALAISGFAVSGGSMGRARRKLATAVDGIVTANGTLSVDEDDGTYELAVRLAAPLRTRQVGPTVVSFDLDLVAANPVKTLVP